MAGENLIFAIAAGGAASSGENIDLTAAAARKVNQLVAAKGRESALLRVFIEGGGCSGFQYGFDFEDAAAEDDLVIERDGVKLLVDPMSVHYLGGARVDYLEDLQGARFVVTNPNASATCGCGSSFSV